MANEVATPLIDKSIKCQKMKQDRNAIGIIGTGNYAVALSKRLIMTGYDVIMASRSPESRQSKLMFSKDCFSTVTVTSISQCLKKCDIVFVAIHVEDFQSTLETYVRETVGKILIDVSNREDQHTSQSNAELLASVLPLSTVVKAFNSISAFTMEDLAAAGGNHRVFVAGNDPAARSAVGDLAKTMGFRVVDLGGLKSALYMENFILNVFSQWKIPVFLTVGIFIAWLLYVVYLYFIETKEYEWEQIFLKVLNKPLCMTAITVLALTYLPGHVAAVCQVYNGTKHKPFPQVLDMWLKSRKQLGLISLFLATIHAIASVLMMSPTYYSSWFHAASVTLPVNTTLTSDVAVPVSASWMAWKGEAASIVGIVAFILMAIIGLTSIPSVGESLNWSEWTCIHSKLSYAVLVLVVCHVLIMGAPNWVKDGPIKTLKSITLLSLLLPLVVLFLKVVFMLPPLKGHIRRIRRGWERNSARKLASNYDLKEIEVQKLRNMQDSLNGQIKTDGIISIAANGLGDCDVHCNCSSL